MIQSSQIKTLILVLAILMVGDSVLAQCAMCRAVLDSDVASNGAKVSEGVNSGILYLMAFPYLLIASVVLYLFKDQLKSLLGFKTKNAPQYN